MSWTLPRTTPGVKVIHIDEEEQLMFAKLFLEETSFDILDRVFGCSQGFFSVVEDGGLVPVLEKGVKQPEALNVGELREMKELVKQQLKNSR